MGELTAEHVVFSGAIIVVTMLMLDWLESRRLFRRRGQLGHVPPAAKRLHQQHARIHASPQDVDLGALVRERHRLRGDHL